MLERPKESSDVKPFTANRDGFFLNAAVAARRMNAADLNVNVATLPGRRSVLSDCRSAGTDPSHYV
jgi:hypothetical protein